MAGALRCASEASWYVLVCVLYITHYLGCTALAMLIAGNKIYVANVGDTRAVLRRGGKAVRLTYDHKPYNPEEVKRIREVGGFVSGDVGRVNGVIAVARSIGDFCAYLLMCIRSCRHSPQDLDIKPYVSAEPHLNELELTPEDDLIVIGCDGVWDVLSDEEAVAIAASTPDPQRAAALVRDAAYADASEDNISTLVIRLKSA